ncbi:antibiotic ABC transporter ATP-binding protein, partial [Mammaliicoccus sciuri]|nr:antibiotic ABC transporter ATP-binding protein [Mammaliicoccus sciuri]
ISSHKLEDIELICDRTVFMKDGAIVEDYDMKAQSKDVTKFIFDHSNYNEALNLLTMNYKVVTSNKQESIISVEALQDYQEVLK